MNSTSMIYLINEPVLGMCIWEWEDRNEKYF